MNCEGKCILQSCASTGEATWRDWDKIDVHGALAARALPTASSQAAQTVHGFLHYLLQCTRARGGVEQK